MYASDSRVGIMMNYNSYLSNTGSTTDTNVTMPNPFALQAGLTFPSATINTGGTVGNNPSGYNNNDNSSAAANLTHANLYGQYNNPYGQFTVGNTTK